MKKGLFALALGTFTLGIAEFIIEGIITDIAHNMHVSIPEAGHLISVYALGVCAGAFSLILMHKYRPKHILMFLASLITFGAMAASVAPTYWILLCARFVAGLPHGAYFGTATIVAVKIAREGKGTNAVAMMCAGMPEPICWAFPLVRFSAIHSVGACLSPAASSSDSSPCIWSTDGCPMSRLCPTMA